MHYLSASSPQLFLLELGVLDSSTKQSSKFRFRDRGPLECVALLTNWYDKPDEYFDPGGRLQDYVHRSLSFSETPEAAVLQQHLVHLLPTKAVDLKLIRMKKAQE